MCIKQEAECGIEGRGTLTRAVAGEDGLGRPNTFFLYSRRLHPGYWTVAAIQPNALPVYPTPVTPSALSPSRRPHPVDPTRLEPTPSDAQRQSADPGGPRTIYKTTLGLNPQSFGNFQYHTQ